MYGRIGRASATVDNLLHLKNCADRVLGDAYEFSVLAAGGRQIAMASMGAIMGGNVRRRPLKTTSLSRPASSPRATPSRLRKSAASLKNLAFLSQRLPKRARGSA
ncbi:MAG: 3-keto-5-aminohexanoate cleavage protein [Parvularculaceae bacterium]